MIRMRVYFHRRYGYLVGIMAVSIFTGFGLIIASPEFTYAYGTLRGWVGVALLLFSLLLLIPIALAEPPPNGNNDELH